MHTLFGHCLPCSRKRESRRSRAIRAIAVAYENSQASDDPQAFIDFVEKQFCWLVEYPTYWLVAYPTSTLSAMNLRIAEFSSRMFAGVLLSNEIINHPALKLENDLTSDVLNRFVSENNIDLAQQALVKTKIKAWILQCVERLYLTSSFKKSAEHLYYTLCDDDQANTTNQLLAVTTTDFIKKYADEIMLTSGQSSLTLTVESPDYRLMNGLQALPYQISALENLIKQEKYKKYEVAANEVMSEFRNLEHMHDKLVANYVDILKNAYDLIVETEALRDNVTGKQHERVGNHTQEASTGALNRYHQSVNALIENPVLSKERKKQISFRCLMAAGTVVVIGSVAAGIATLVPFPFLLLIGMLGYGVICVGHFALQDTGLAFMNSSKSRFRHASVFAEKIQNLEQGSPQTSTPSTPLLAGDHEESAAASGLAFTAEHAVFNR